MGEAGNPPSHPMDNHQNNTVIIQNQDIFISTTTYFAASPASQQNGIENGKQNALLVSKWIFLSTAISLSLCLLILKFCQYNKKSSSSSPSPPSPKQKKENALNDIEKNDIDTISPQESNMNIESDIFDALSEIGAKYDDIQLHHQSSISVGYIEQICSSLSEDKVNIKADPMDVIFE